MVVATTTLLIGTILIYGFGAGYFGYFSVPTPVNFVVAPVLVLGLILVLWRSVTRRL